MKTKLQTQNLQPCPNRVSKSVILVVNSSHPINNRYHGASHTVMRIWREEGVVGFLRGILPRMMVHAPAVAISWTAYEFMKTFLHRYN